MQDIGFINASFFLKFKIRSHMICNFLSHFWWWFRHNYEFGIC